MPTIRLLRVPLDAMVFCRLLGVSDCRRQVDEDVSQIGPVRQDLTYLLEDSIFTRATLVMGDLLEAVPLIEEGVQLLLHFGLTLLKRLTCPMQLCPERFQSLTVVIRRSRSKFFQAFLQLQ